MIATRIIAADCAHRDDTVGNAVPGVPTAEGGGLVHVTGTVLTHRTRRNAGDGVPYEIVKNSPVSGETGDFLGSEVQINRIRSAARPHVSWSDSNRTTNRFLVGDAAKQNCQSAPQPDPTYHVGLLPQCEQFSRRASRLSAGRGQSRRRRPASRPRPR